MGRRIVEVSPDIAIEVMQTGWTSAGHDRDSYIECTEGLPADAKLVSCWLYKAGWPVVRLEFESAEWPDDADGVVPKLFNISYMRKRFAEPLIVQG